ERGLEFAFHVEEICWLTMLEGIGEKTGVKPKMETSLRLAHIERGKLLHKKEKAKKSLEQDQITKEEYDKEIVMLDRGIEKAPMHGLYRFE
ncbi:MAG: hypothetical protein ACFFFK_04935, partial [Candidatus Thorarchaeota archaeon]